MTLEQAINNLEKYDGGIWNKILTIKELEECILDAMLSYEDNEPTYLFYLDILNKLD